jgi:hypothetical protein
MTLFPDEATGRLLVGCRTYLREPATVTLDTNGAPVLTFDPPLTVEEQATYATLVASLDSPVTLTPAEWATIRPDIQNIRDLRQMGRNAFMALSAAERDRLLYDAQAATTTILLALLRE